MITAKEANRLVSLRQRCEDIELGYRSYIAEAEQIIINRVNSGWLCANLGRRFSDTLELVLIERHLKKLGYSIDKEHIVYWVFADPKFEPINNVYHAK